MTFLQLQTFQIVRPILPFEPIPLYRLLTFWCVVIFFLLAYAELTKCLKKITEAGFPYQTVKRVYNAGFLKLNAPLTVWLSASDLEENTN